MKQILLIWMTLLILVAIACTEPTAPPAEDAAAEEPAATEVTEAEPTEVPAEEDVSATSDMDEEALVTLKQEALTTYSDIVFASYADSHALAVELQAALETFVAAPSEETHQAAKAAWLAANEPYGQTEAYRFYGGPIDDEDGPEGLLNAWPLDEEAKTQLYSF